MLDFSLAELLLIAVVAVVFIGPKDMPVVLRAVARGLAHVKSLAAEFKQLFDELAQESGVRDFERDVEREMKMITGDDGQEYEAYDISDLTEKKP